MGLSGSVDSLVAKAWLVVRGGLMGLEEGERTMIRRHRGRRFHWQLEVA
jgi:hypothetical protein